MLYLCIPLFCCIKVEFKGVYIAWACFRDPHFYIVKLEFEGVNLILLLLLQNIDCGCSLEPHRRGGSNVYPRCSFEQKKYERFSNEIFIFIAECNFYILLGKFS